MINDKRGESFLPNTNNFLVFFIVLEWGIVFESAMDQQEVKYNPKLGPNYFCMNVSAAAVVFHRQTSKN